MPKWMKVALPLLAAALALTTAVWGMHLSQASEISRNGAAVEAHGARLDAHDRIFERMNGTMLRVDERLGRMEVGIAEVGATQAAQAEDIREVKEMLRRATP